MAMYAAAPPVQPPPGDACASCGAPEAADQRYCLECGERRAGLTPLYLQTPRPLVRVAGPVTSEAEPASLALAPAHGPTTALAVLGCLLLAMGVGVLIGRSGNRTARPAAAPAQVINVSTPGAATGATGASTLGAAAAAAAAAAAPVASAKHPQASSSSGAKGAPAAPPAAIQALQNSTGKQYVQRSKNLPTTTTTGGKPPPVDHKPAGAGSGSVTIG